MHSRKWSGARAGPQRASLTKSISITMSALACTIENAIMVAEAVA